MKVFKYVAGAGLLFLIVGALVWLNRIKLILLVAWLQIPHVGANHAVTWAQGPTAPAAPRDRLPPNIVVILADDLGYNDITAHGGGVAGGVVPTPNIDGIARGGVDFVRGYAGNATCAPSRAAIMTGRYATRFGFEFTPAPVAFARVIAAMGKDDLHPPVFHEDVVENIPLLDQEAVPASEVTIASLLQRQGYHTLHIGKWHLGGAKGSRPEDKGFDESLGFIPGASLYLPADAPDVVNSRQDFDPIDRFLWAGLPWGVQYNGSPWFKPASYMTDYLAQQAVAAIHANRNRPFLLYFAPNAVHTPLQAARADYDALAQIPDHRMRVYAAMVRNLDRNVGHVLDALKAEGLERDTIVIFTSDNGGANYIGLPDINYPFRGWKATFFEGGIHVPFFMRWPGHIAPSSTYSRPVAHVDIFATAAAAAGGQLPADRVMDGVDLLPFLSGENPASPHKSLFWRSGNYQVLLEDGWKLQTLHDPPTNFLFNLNADPDEHHDLISSEPAKRDALAAVMARIDGEQVKARWPSVLSGAIAVDHPGGVEMQPKDVFIYWDN